MQELRIGALSIRTGLEQRFVLLPETDPAMALSRISRPVLQQQRTRRLLKLAGRVERRTERPSKIGRGGGGGPAIVVAREHVHHHGYDVCVRAAGRQGC